MIYSAALCFICPFGLWYLTAVYFFVEERPPTVVETYENVPGQTPVSTQYKTIINGDDVEFLCYNGTVEQNPDFVWNKDGYSITYEKSKIELNNDTGILSIFGATIDDGGYYECFYSGFLESAIQVKVAEPPKIFQFEISKAKLGEKSTISCNVKYGANPMEIKLLKNGKEIWRDYSVRNTTSRKAVLKIKNVTENDEATYTCVTHTEGYYDFQTAKLEIENEPKKMYDVYHLNEGESFTMTCNTPANFSNVVWKKEIVGNDGTRYYLDVVGVTHNGKVVLNDVSKEQSGTYWCVYDNEIDIHVGAINRLIISPVPRILNTYDESYVVVNKGQNQSVKMKILGKEISMIEWYRKGKLIKMKDYNTANRYVNNFIQDGVLYTELVLENIKMDDGGKYICVVYNEHGQDYTAVVVGVDDGPMTRYLLIALCVGTVCVIFRERKLFRYLCRTVLRRSRRAIRGNESNKPYFRKNGNAHVIQHI